jgi:hypothetical protein
LLPTVGITATSPVARTTTPFNEGEITDRIRRPADLIAGGGDDH